jgi:hypothetical protein
VLQKHHHVTYAHAVVAALIKFLQMMNFIVSAHAGFHWHSSIVETLAVLVNPIGKVLQYVHLSPAAYTALFYSSLLWVALFVGLTIWAVYGFISNSFSALWPLKLLRSIATFSTSVLYIPLATVLFGGLACDGPFTEASTCGEPGSVALKAITAVLLLLFIALCMLFTLVFYDSNMVSASALAKSHARVEFFFLLIKTCLVILIEAFPHMVRRAARARPGPRPSHRQLPLLRR